MQNQGGLQKFLPHFLVIGLFIIISCWFCLPAFQGKTLDQHDIKTWLWMSRESREYFAQTGENALWANNMFSGMPQVQTDYHPLTNWYNKLHNIVQLTSPGTPPNPAIFFFLAMFSFYLLSAAMRVNKWIGAIGAVAFAFSTYNPQIVTAGHITKMLDIAYIPAIMAGILWAYRGSYFLGAAVTGLFLAFFFDANHIQIIYYSLFIIACMAFSALIKAIRNGKIKQWAFASLALGLAALFAVGTSASRLIQTMEYNPYSIRGKNSELSSVQKNDGLDKDYAFQWSNGGGELLTLIVPGLYGAGEHLDEDSHYGKALSSLGVPNQQVEQMTANAPMYWGPQPFLSGSIYFGAIVCFLTVLSLFTVRSKEKWWIFGLSVLFMLLSMGHHFPALNYFMFDHFPLYNKFRSPNMMLAIPSVLFPMLAIWGLKEIGDGHISKPELLKKLRWSLIITGGLCILVWLASNMMLDFKGANDSYIQQQFGEKGGEIMKAIREDRAGIASTNALRSLLFVLLGGALIWAFAKDKLNVKLSLAALALLVVLDIMPVAKRYLNERNFVDTDLYETLNFQPGKADQEILKDPAPYYRVANLSASLFQDAKTSYFHNSVGGYHGAKMRIYQDLIEAQLGKLNSSVFNMLNTKYFILPGQNGEEIPQRNPYACGNAWFVEEVKWAPTATEEMNALSAPSLNNPSDSTMGDFNPSRTAIIRDDFKGSVKGSQFQVGPDAYIKLLDNGYSPKELKFESSNDQPGLAVFSDIYYPNGWKATIDGQEAPIIRANYVLRALEVPAGKHAITFVFDPPSFYTGERVALWGSILLTLFIAGCIFGIYKKRNKQI